MLLSHFRTSQERGQAIVANITPVFREFTIAIIYQKDVVLQNTQEYCSNLISKSGDFGEFDFCFGKFAIAKNRHEQPL